jgi:hypothetical protein
MMRLKKIRNVFICCGFAFTALTAWADGAQAGNDENDPDAPITAAEAKKEMKKALDEFGLSYNRALQLKKAAVLAMCHDDKEKGYEPGKATACAPMRELIEQNCHPNVGGVRTGGLFDYKEGGLEGQLPRLLVSVHNMVDNEAYWRDIKDGSPSDKKSDVVEVTDRTPSQSASSDADADPDDAPACRAMNALVRANRVLRAQTAWMSSGVKAYDNLSVDAGNAIKDDRSAACDEDKKNIDKLWRSAAGLKQLPTRAETKLNMIAKRIQNSNGCSDAVDSEKENVGTEDPDKKEKGGGGHHKEGKMKYDEPKESKGQKGIPFTPAKPPKVPKPPKQPKAPAPKKSTMEDDDGTTNDYDNATT